MRAYLSDCAETCQQGGDGRLGVVSLTVIKQSLVYYYTKNKTHSLNSMYHKSL